MEAVLFFKGLAATSSNQLQTIEIQIPNEERIVKMLFCSKSAENIGFEHRTPVFAGLP